MNRIDQTQAVNPGTAQAVYGNAGSIPEDLRARSRQSWAGRGEAHRLRSSAPPVDSAEISTTAWQYYLRRDDLSADGSKNSSSASSYSGFRNEKKSMAEFILWQRSEDDRGYLSERLAGDPGARSEANNPEDYTLQRLITLLYLSGSRTQRVAFSHYQPKINQAGAGSRAFTQAADSGQPAFYQTNI